MFKDFFNNYGLGIISTIITGIFGFLGLKIKEFLDEKSKNEYIEKSVNKTVKAVEQMYKDLTGSQKYEKAVEDISEMLSIKGIAITELEIRILIESAVAEFNKPWLKEGDSDDN